MLVTKLTGSKKVIALLIDCCKIHLLGLLPLNIATMYGTCVICMYQYPEMMNIGI